MAGKKEIFKQVQVSENIKLRQGYFVTSHVNLKKVYDWFLIREYLLSVNSSGLYDICEFKKACEATKINYNTARARISCFESCGLLVRNKAAGVIKIVELTGNVERLYNLFERHRNDIEQSKNPKVYFADLWKRRLIKSNVVSQAFKEAEKCNDRNIARKYLRTVKGSNTQIGASSGINLALSTIGNIIGRSKATAHRAVERMNGEGMIKVKKQSLFVCHVSQVEYFKRKDNLYGRLFVDDFKVFERMQNVYSFCA